MDFTTISSVSSYTKTMKMQMRWDMKKQSGNITAHTSSLDEWMTDPFRPSDEENGSEQDSKLSSILQKAYSGQKLSEAELSYIQTRDPLAYQKICSLRQEQKTYEQELKKCKTKEDVQRLKMSRVTASLSNVKSIANNPHIPEEKKLQMINLEKMRCDKLERSTRKFVKSNEYKQLPTEAEQAKAHQEMKEAEETARTEKTEQSGKPDQSEETGQNAKPAPTEKEEHPDKAPAKKQESKRDAMPDFTVRQESLKVRKVRRAKAKAAYVSVQESAEEESAPALDTQA